MTPADYQNFYSAWLNAHAMSSSNQTPSDSTIMAVFDLLMEYPLQHVVGALQVHAKKSRFAPTPADICEIIDGRTNAKHVSADEAWVIAKKSMDESETVVLTDEIFQARNVAWELFIAGDAIGARMAFKSAYERIVESAGKPVWRLVAGWDKSRIAKVVDDAKRLGRLPADYKPSKHLLPTPKAETTVTTLLENLQQRVELTEQDTQKNKRNIASIKAMLNGGDVEAGIKAREEKRQQFEFHRQNELKRLAEKQNHLH